MSDTISLTIPRHDEQALKAGATLLLTLAEDTGGALSRDDDDAPAEAPEPEPAVAPPPPPPPVEPPATGAELDADGLPWDRRIHASTQAKIADGTWRKRRGVDTEEYNRVVEELRQLMAADTGASPPPPVEAPPPPTTFTEFLRVVGHRIQEREWTMDDVTAALPEGVANLQLLSGRADLIPQVWAALTRQEDTADE